MLESIKLYGTMGSFKRKTYYDLRPTLSGTFRVGTVLKNIKCEWNWLME